jgi:hypothetical protein
MKEPLGNRGRRKTGKRKVNEDNGGHYEAATRVRGKSKNRMKGIDKFFGLEKGCGHINHHVGNTVFCKDVNVRS